MPILVQQWTLWSIKWNFWPVCISRNLYELLFMVHSRKLAFSCLRTPGARCYPEQLLMKVGVCKNIAHLQIRDLQQISFTDM